ncbi:hypothetical protein BS17DRAFT_776292 [Gyrodon lividus]|nr:hypothetical protein BS17DRAFT_776292 [Gyrodon lividus]
MSMILFPLSSHMDSSKAIPMHSLFVPSSRGISIAMIPSFDQTNPHAPPCMATTPCLTPPTYGRRVRSERWINYIPGPRSLMPRTYGITELVTLHFCWFGCDAVGTSHLIRDEYSGRLQDEMACCLETRLQGALYGCRSSLLHGCLANSLYLCLE